MGANRPMKKVDGNSPACYLPPPPREKLPMMLLLEQRHFEMFFSLLQQLSCFKQSAVSLFTVCIEYVTMKNMFFIAWCVTTKVCLWCA